MLSIIIPVYNSEKYLSECIDSIRNQSYKEWELLLIDDGSIDSSVKICEEFCKIDVRIKFIRQTHKGTSAARISGIENSVGEYITFVDSDDWLDERALEKLLTPMLHDQCVDISLCSYTKHQKIVKVDMCSAENDKKENYSASEALNLMFENKAFTWSLWGKIYKKELFFKDDMIIDNCPKVYGEDTYINWKVFRKAKNVVYIPLNLYHYRVHPESVMNKCVTDGMLVYFDVYRGILSEINDLHSTLAQNIITAMLEIGLYILRELTLSRVRTQEWYISYEILQKYLKVYECTLTEHQKQILSLISKTDEELDVMRRKCFSEFKCFCSRYDRCFIYGAGKLANEVAEIMEVANMPFQGFVVSDAIDNSRILRCKKVYTLDFIKREYANKKIGIITGLGKKNLAEVHNMLAKISNWGTFDGTRLNLRNL